MTFPNISGVNRIAALSAIVAQALYRLSSFLVVLAAAAVVSVAELGRLNILMSYAVTAGAAIIFGFDVLLNRDVSAGRQESGYVQAILLLKACLTVLVTPLAMIVVIVVLGASSVPLLSTLLIGAVFAALAETFETVLVAQRKDVERSISIGVSGVAAIMLSIALIMTPMIASVWYFASIILLRDVLRFGLSCYLVGVRPARFIVPDMSILWRVLRKSAPFAFIAVAAYLTQRIDLTLIQILLGPDQLGLYTPAATIALGAAVIPSGIGPMIVRALSANRAIAGRLAATMFAMGAVIAALIAGLFPVLAGAILPREYRESMGVLLLLVVAVPFAYCNSVLLRRMYVLDLEALASKLLVCSMIINVVSNILMLPAMGLLGAGVSTIVSESALSVMLLHGLLRRGNDWR